MKLRRRSTITREGWYYLFILGFVIVGSLLRHINLLVGLSAILSTAMILNWRVTRASLRQIRFDRREMPPVFCNRPTTFEVEVENQRRYLTSFSIMVSQHFRPKQVRTLVQATPSRLQKIFKFFSGNSVSNYVLLDHVHVGQSRVAPQIIEFRDRGEYEMGPLTVSSHFPLGLTRREVTDTERRPLFVGPALGTLSYGWVDRMLGLGWQDSAGGTTSRTGDEFFSLRPWLNGDSRRWVHWRATARHGTVLVRQFQRSQSHAFSLIVDLSLPASSNDPTSSQVHLTEIEKILRIVATISQTVYAGQVEAASIYLVTDKIHSIHFPCSEEKWLEWHQLLSTVQASENHRRFFEALLNDSRDLGLSVPGNSPPAVVLSPQNVDQFTQEVRDFQAGRRPTSLQETREPASNTPSQPTLQPEGESSSIATLDLQSSAGRLWDVQRQIRTWVTPGDARLGSWYVDAPEWKTDPTDLNLTEESD